jgi:DNA invertase Pin-like site-specific DNA recombinase
MKGAFMSKRIAIYARTSTAKFQTTQNQIDALTELANRQGYTIIKIYSDNGFSGTKSTADRPALNELMKDARKKSFDMVLVWSLDRLGRSLKHCLELLQELQELKVDLFFQQQGMDTSTSSGKLMFSMIGAFAEFERNIIRERVMAGQMRAKANGVKFGRPSKMNDGMKSAVKLLRERGMGIKQIAKQLQIGVGTVYSVMSV